MNILICDDNENDIKTLSDLVVQYGSLKNIGLDVYSYKSGDELLKAFDTIEPGIIFLDVNMDGIDGLTLARKIRDRYEEVPIGECKLFCVNLLD